MVGAALAGTVIARAAPKTSAKPNPPIFIFLCFMVFFLLMTAVSYAIRQLARAFRRDDASVHADDRSVSMQHHYRPFDASACRAVAVSTGRSSPDMSLFLHRIYPYIPPRLRLACIFHLERCRGCSLRLHMSCTNVHICSCIASIAPPARVLSAVRVAAVATQSNCWLQQRLGLRIRRR